MTDACAYVSSLQGRPWSVEDHCWELVRETQRVLFGRALPVIVIDEKPSALQLVRAFHGHAERRRWRETAVAIDGAIVLMHRPGTGARAIHAGTFLALDGGGVLHVDDPHGVVFDTALDLGLRNWACEHYVPS